MFDNTASHPRRQEFSTRLYLLLFMIDHWVQTLSMDQGQTFLTRQCKELALLISQFFVFMS
jgi:hypothetical protein